MITRDTMFTPLLTACPSFQAQWDAFCEEYTDETPHLPHYIALGDLAHHLVTLYKAGKTSEFNSVFAVVERWHLEGDDYVREAATIGFLEGLQNVAGNKGLDPEVFVPWLHPESKKWWDELDKFWERVEAASIPVRLAHLDDLERLWPLYEQLDEHHRLQRPDIFQVPEGPRRSAEFLKERIDNPDCALFVAEHADRIVGLATVMVREKPETLVKRYERFAEIDEIVVDPTYRRKRIGGLLFDACRTWAEKQTAIAAIRLNVFEFNEEALSFYSNKGFKTLQRTMEFTVSPRNRDDPKT